MKKILAILSPNVNAYSETFVQAHKQLPFDIKFYYNGWIPTQLEGAADLNNFNILERIKKRFKTTFTVSQHALRKSLKREKVDCVLAEYFLSAAKNLKVIQSLNLPLIVHFHGYDATYRPDLEQYKREYQLVFAYAKAVIAVSYKMKKDLLAIGCPSEKLFVAHYGPDPHFLELNPKYKSKQFIAVGRFADKKAPYHTIGAFKKVVTQYPKALLVMVGDGPLMFTCKNLVKVWGLEDNIKFTGVLKPVEIRKLMEESLAFVQHSVITDTYDSEGTPVVILEAQAARLPVISTFHAGIPDVVINNVTGLMVEEHDVKGMADHMLSLLSKDGLAAQMGTAGRNRILEHFTREKNLNQLRLIIESVCP